MKKGTEEEKIEQEIEPEVSAAAAEPEKEPVDEVSALKEQIQKLEAEKAEMKDQFLRKAADFDNFRKRLIRDKEDAVSFANTSLLTDLIDVLDDFERAEAAAKKSQDFETLANGVDLIEKRLATLLEKKWGLTKYVPLNEAFDPEKHEALMMTESPDVKEATVAEVFQNGYILHDRVIRHAKVKVSMPAKNN
ncbi:MAG: nucleotide exchange factor GrpE [Spirochaetia bacterium]|nr:nucleotide exchange factor GrpE [Spirochaetia bacterium]MBQ3647340.1 nucleotide exchange factor GrpE [Spirochaetia bacterium]MBQ3712456.1 nucleotide exchange factor GrpE [Spirochaetia bacterium]MBQ6673002.1 nucleotide exchange factor GrpE [Spirochaetia bacterium]MBQ6904847.1 nucleotide exchange factor GrpE [Spirochaetia bacterium]